MAMYPQRQLQSYLPWLGAGRGRSQHAKRTAREQLSSKDDTYFDMTRNEVQKLMRVVTDLIRTISTYRQIIDHSGTGLTALA